jgi:hypothetical protein
VKLRLPGSRRRLLARYPKLNPAKLRVIDYCFEQLGSRSFADLGGVWGIDGAYARYATEAHRPDRGVVVDENFTDAYLTAERGLPNLTHFDGNFGSRETTESLGEVDVAFFFDVLLHQVAPDWDEVLALYAPVARRVAIVQPQWNGPHTIRLLDLGEAEYLAAIPKRDDAHGSIYDGLFGRLDEINVQRDRPWRDVHDIWQWGITDDDLTARMAALGYELRLQESTGPWQGLGRFHEGVFVFERP